MRYCVFLPALVLVLALAAPALAAELTKPPQLQQFVEASFPSSETGHTGSVVLAVTIAADGAVEDVSVITSASVDFDAAAVAAARQFRFVPAEVDGKPSRIRIQYRYDFVEKVAAPTTAIFIGLVRDAATGAPVPNVTVTLANGASAVTGDDGRFEIKDVPAGPQNVILEGEKLTALATEESFVAGQQLDATYDVALRDDSAPDADADDMEIIVSAPALTRQVVSTEVSADEARKIPGTSGDVLKVVESLPGVARASLGTGDLVVWGAAPGDTGVYVDGVPVPRLYHDGGLRSVIGSDLVKSVELIPGGYGAAYGRGLGGLIDVTTNRFDTPGGEVAADLYDASAAAHGAIGKRVDVGVAGRYGYVGPLLASFYPGVEDYFPVPHYWDAQGRVGFELGPGRTLDLTGLISSDATRSTAVSADPARQASESKRLDFQRVSLRYAHDDGAGTTVSAVVFAGADQSADVETYGPVATSIDDDVALFGARGSFRARVLPTLTAEGGLDALVTRSFLSRTGSVAMPSREGDVRMFGQPPPDQIASDRFHVVEVNVAPYVEADLGLLKDTLHLVPGLRVDPYARSVSRAAPQLGVSPTHGLLEQDFQAEPRLSVRWSPSQVAHVNGAWGLYGQQPAATDLSASFGNPALPAEHGSQYLLGGGVKPTSGSSLDVTGFYTHSANLAMRSSAAEPALAEALEPTGQGRAYGVQAMLRLDPVVDAKLPLSGWVSYTLAWSERKDAASGWRPSDYDQRHVLTALASYELPFGITAGVRARIATGFPRTDVVGAYYDNRRDLYEPLFGDHNATRLPTFFQADARIARTFNIRSSKLDLSLEVQNLTNQQNVEEFTYNADYTEQGAITGLPILPVLGARWQF